MINNNNITQTEFKVMVQALFDNQTKFILVESIDGMLTDSRFCGIVY